ncbi:MAG: hypothetical protein ACRD2O_00060 [Terriglobia bacterium]
MAEESRTQTVEVAQPRPLESLSAKQYEDWRMTGQIPEEGAADEKKIASAKDATDAQAPQDEKKERPARMHYSELRRKVRELQTENERLRMPVGEAPPATPKDQPREHQRAEDAGKTREKPQPADKDEKGAPKYKTYEDYIEDLADWKTDRRIADYRREQETAQRDTAIAKQNREIEQSWSGRVEKAKRHHADFEKALDPKEGPGADIAPGSVLDQWILESPEGAEMLYFFAHDRAELRRIGRLHPIAAARELAALEAALSEDSRPAKTEPRTTRTPPPAREVGGRGTAASDEVQKAVADDDVGAYIDAANRRELAKNRR